MLECRHGKRMTRATTKRKGKSKMASQNKSIEILNACQKFIVNYANDNGIVLAVSFASVEDFKKFVFALTFKTLIDTGMATDEAYDMLMGNGAYEEMAAKVWAMAQ